MVCLKKLSLATTAVLSISETAVAAPLTRNRHAALAKRPNHGLPVLGGPPGPAHVRPMPIIHVKAAPRGIEDIFEPRDLEIEDYLDQRDLADEFEERDFEDELYERDLERRRKFNFGTIANIGKKVENVVKGVGLVNGIMGAALPKRDLDYRLVAKRAAPPSKNEKQSRVGLALDAGNQFATLAGNIRGVVAAIKKKKEDKKAPAPQKGKRSLDELERRAFEDLIRELYF
ncbi:unnamed protein product [Clonostachys rosea]|uniref:Uncharacterized protein n=1 Tax=Bionectria ochroleuca TaxID=29856 RepID=A0ABY6UCH7_BIOOC|nr:unnamed protein product [Clonostachys rosea]